MVEKTLTIGTNSWSHPSWQADFYPDDLPTEWQLAYYANEFSCILVSDTLCLQSDMTQWCDDTPNHFSIIIDCTWPITQALCSQIQQLQQRCKAILITAPHNMTDQYITNNLPHKLPSTLSLHRKFTLDSKTHCHILSTLKINTRLQNQICMVELLDSGCNLQCLRHQIEHFKKTITQHGFFIMIQPISSKTLHDAQIISNLL